MKTIITTWFPILTFCPVNKLPDFIFVKIEFTEFAELYDVRKQMRALLSGKTIFMEDAAKLISSSFKCEKVTVSLMFNKHVVIWERGNG